MKKSYIQPEVSVMEIELKNVILAASDGTMDPPTPGSDDETDDPYA